MSEHWDVYRKPSEASDETGAPAPTAVPEADGSSSITVRIGRRTAVAVVAVVVLCVAALLVVLVVGASRSGQEQTARVEGAKALPAAKYAPLVDAPGFAKLAAAVRTRTGSTKVLQFSAYSSGYSVIVPPAKGKDIAQLLFLEDDGTFSDPEPKAVEPYQRPFDLTALDPAMLERLHKQAWDKTPGTPAGSSVRVEAPESTSEGWISVFVDETDRTFYALDAGLDGQVGKSQQIGS